jgi:hypothetical protein
MQRHRVDSRKDRSIRGDTERERQYRDDGEARTLD